MDTGGGSGKRLLLIAYSYPPTGGYGGVRPLNLARYLPMHGWRVTVLTVGRERTRWGVGDPSEGELPGVKVLRAPFPDLLTFVKSLLLRAGVLQAAGPGDETRLRAAASTGKRPLGAALDKAIRCLKRWASFPDRYLLWFPFAFTLGARELHKERYDAILSTSPPVMDHLLAAAFHGLTGVPWVADFRDPWTQNPLLRFTRFELLVTRALEKRVIRTAKAITTVSGPLTEMLEELHGGRGAGVVQITNAYDPRDYGGEVKPLEGRFVITYAGMFYGSMRDPGAFMEAVEELIDEGAIGPDEILVRIYGPGDPVVNEARAALRHPGILEVNEAIPRREVIERERESTALLILSWDHPYSALVYGGKVFEYLGARRPILAWNPAGGVLERLLEETGAGVSVSSKEELKAVLGDWFEEYRETGTLRFRGDAARIRRFAWDHLSGEMAAVLEAAGQGRSRMPLRR